jgi:hypothetical protein
MRMSNDVNDNYVKQYTGPYGPVVGLSPDDGRPKVESERRGYRWIAARQESV